MPSTRARRIRYGAIVLYTIFSANGHVAEATVIGVRLSAT
jgi:hypothetical protein